MTTSQSLSKPPGPGGAGAARQFRELTHENVLRHRDRELSMSIRILVTGGTFDKEYDELTGRLFFQDTHLPEMLRRGRCRLEVTIETVMMIDSLDLDAAGRAEIVRRCRAASESCLVITHGTDTMVDTARALAEADLEGKTVVLTGAMVPYA